jgi:ectoine hydroxylase-related dioxygenase (phytanoyl-CoA dioxygenase family)
MTTVEHSSELDEEYPVPAEAVACLRRDGFVKLPAVLSPATIAAYEPEITATLFERNTQILPLEQRSTYHKAFLQVTNMWPHNEAVRRFAFSARLAKIAADLLEVESVRLFADQGLYKEAGGGITPWHADQYYWPLSSDRSITVWVPLQETPGEMGPLSFAVGSHRLELGRDIEISDESEAAVRAAVDAAGLEVEDGPYALGEVSYHLGWTFHHANPNHTGTPRKVMTIIYVDAEIRVSPPVNRAHLAVLRDVIPGAKVGGPIDTPVNPVLWPPSKTF